MAAAFAELFFYIKLLVKVVFDEILVKVVVCQKLGEENIVSSCMYV